MTSCRPEETCVAGRRARSDCPIESVPLHRDEPKRRRQPADPGEQAWSPWVTPNPSTRSTAGARSFGARMPARNVIHAMEKRIEAERDDRRLQILNWFLANEHEAQGNEAAARAVRCRDPAVEIHDWHYEWMKNPPDIDIIPVLEDRIRGETHPARLHALRFLLAS